MSFVFFRLWIKFNHKSILCRDLRRALCISGWNTMDITGKRHLPLCCSSTTALSAVNRVRDMRAPS